MNYVVRPGDTLWSIASRFGTTVQAIMQANGLSNPNYIYAGLTLYIPVPGPPFPPAPPFPPGPPGPPFPPGPPGPDNLERRVTRLERQVEQLTSEVQRLRRRVDRLEQQS